MKKVSKKKVPVKKGTVKKEAKKRPSSAKRVSDYNKRMLEKGFRRMYLYVHDDDRETVIKYCNKKKAARNVSLAA